MHRSRVALAAAGVLLLFAGGITCTDLSGPKAGLSRVGLAPRFTKAAADSYRQLTALAVEIDNIRVRLKRGDGASALDTVVARPAGAETVTIELTVRLNGNEEQFLAVIDLRAGEQVLFSGTQTVIARTTGSTSPPPVDVEYVGPGATAVDVNVIPSDTAILSNQTVAFDAVAFDQNEQEITDLLISWSVRDPAIGSVSAQGVFTPAGARGSTWVIATLPTGVKDSASVTVSPLPTTAVVISGGGQIGTVGQTLSPFVFELRAADQLPVAGVAVSFNVASGGGEIFPASATTGEDGRASVTLTLGAAPGENAVQLLVADAVFATASATAVTGAPAGLALEGAGTISIVAGQTIPAEHAVRVVDALGNPVPNVQVLVALTPRGFPQEVLAQVTSTSGQDGRVQLSVLGALGQAGSFDVRATIVEPAGRAPVIVPLDVAPGSGASLAFSTQPPATQAGAPFTVVVEIRDGQGNVVTSFTGPVAIALANNPTQASLNGTLVRNAVSGVATFDDLAIERAAQGYTLSASAEGFTSAASTAFDVAAGPVSALAFAGLSPIVGVGTPFTIVVAAQDGFGNVVTGFTDQVTIALATNPSDAVLSGTLSQNAVAGVATFSDLSLNAGGVGYTLSASSGTLSVASAPFDAIDSQRFVWIAASGGNWSDGGNWDRGAPPGPADTAVIALDGNYSVTLDQSASIATIEFGGTSGQQRLLISANTLTVSTLGIFTQNSALELSGGTIDGPGGIVLSGQFFWTGGTLTGAGSLQTTPGSLTEISGGTKTLTQRFVGIGGNGIWLSGDIFTGSAAQFHVLAGGSLTVGADLSFNFNQGGSPPALVNGGTLTTSGTFVVSGMFNNAGALSVDAGVLRLIGGGSWVPTSIGLADDAIIEFAGGSHALGGTVALTGAGEVRVSGANVSIVGQYSSTGITRITAGTMAFEAEPATLAQLFLTNGTLSGAGEVNVSGQFTWSGGSLGGTGSTNVLAGATATFDGAVKSLSQRLVGIAGAANWTLGDINAGSSGRLNVLAGGTMNIPGGVQFVYNLGGAPPSVNNAGSLGVAGSVAISGEFNNSGTLDVQPGLLTLSGGGIWSGTQGVSVAGGAVVSLTGGTHSLGGPINVSGTGEVQFAGANATITGTYVSAGITRVSAGTAAFSASQAGQAAQLIVSGGTVGGTGRLDVTQAFTWSGGGLADLGVLNVNAGATASLEAGVKSLSQHLLQIEGSASWTAGNVNSGSGGQFTVAAGGSLAVGGGVSMVFNLGGGAPALNNEGTLTTNGTVAVSGMFNNSGTLTVESGVLTLSGGGTWSGAQGVTVADGSLVTLTGGTHALGGAINVAGTGEMRFDGANATVSGTYTNSGITRVSNGTAAFSTSTPASTVQLIVSGGALDGSGELDVTGSFAWSGGSLNGTGTTQVNANATATLNGGAKSLSARTLRLIGNATWTAGDIASGSAGQLTVASGSTLSATDVAMQFSLGGSPPALNNAGTLTTNGTVVVNAAFNNTGSVSVQSGSLTLLGGGAWSGTPVVSIPAPGSLAFNGGTHALGGTISVSGGGTVFYGGATVAVTGTYTSTATTRVTLGSVAFNTTQTTSLTQLFVTGGTLGGSAVVDVGQSFTWSGGTLSGSGVTNVVGNASATLDGAAKDLSQRTLAIAGTATWSAGNINSGSDARFHVLGTGSLAITGTVAIIHNLGGGQPRFVVDGTVQPIASVTMGIPFDNQGSLVVEGGTFTMTAGGAWKGTLNVGINLNAVVDLAAGNFTHEGLLTSMGLQSGVGTMRFSGADVAISGSYRVMGAAEVANGAMTISQDLTVDGQLVHSGGRTTILGNFIVNGIFGHSGGTITSGNVNFAGQIEQLVGGTLEVTGNFTLTADGDTRRMLSTDAHTTRFIGTSTGRQLNWNQPAVQTSANFGVLEFATTGAEGVVLAGNGQFNPTTVVAAHVIIRGNAVFRTSGSPRFVLMFGGKSGQGIVIDDLGQFDNQAGATVQIANPLNCDPATELVSQIRTGPYTCVSR